MDDTYYLVVTQPNKACSNPERASGQAVLKFRGKTIFMAGRFRQVHVAGRVHASC